MSAGRGAHALQLGGIVGAVVLAAIVNVLSARHFARWDWTSDRRWSPSPATTETLHGLEQRVDVWVVVGPGEALAQSLGQMLTSYQALTSRLEVHWIDPDRDAVQLVDLQRRFGLEAGRTEDGRVATDAAVIVASGDKQWFLTPTDLYEQSDETHVRPREERALTQAIRSVLGGERTTLCFTVGHGELSLEGDPGDREGEGLAASGLRDLLDKNNYELRSVDTTAPDAHEPFRGCAVVVIAGAQAPFAPAETNRLRTWLLEGGSLFAALGPMEGPGERGLVPAGLDEALGPFGIATDDDLVHDVDGAISIPDTHGEGFFVEARVHPVTRALVPGAAEAHPPRSAVFFTRSLRHVQPPGAAAAADLLVTSDGAYGTRNVVGASTWKDAAPRDSSDVPGPLVVAMASERPLAGAASGHGARAVVVGTRFALSADNWRQPRPLHGTAFFVDSALSWLAARPAVVDVPDRAEVTAGVRITEAARGEVERYVLFFMPLAALLLGAAVWAWRRAAENKPYAPGSR